MRIPEFFFPLVNRVMKLLLNSPLHGIMSASVMTIHFTGRKSGRAGSTPVRYLHEDDDAVVCLTSRETRWWQNFSEPAAVELQIAGRRVAATAYARPNDTARKEAVLKRLLDRYPGDAPYHGIAGSRGAPSSAQFNAAVANDVVVDFTLGN